MLLGTFLIILAISLILTIIGFAFSNVLFSLIGTVSIFLIGIMLLSTPIQYVSGETTSLNYGVELNNSWANDGGLVPNNPDPYVFNTNSTNIYSNYSDTFTHTFSYFLMILGALAFVLILFAM